MAAGSLFTSCIDPVEPNGIYDLREAKADYLAALSGLRAADAEVREAEAAYWNAQAAVQQAFAEQEQAKAEVERLKAELKKVENEKDKADYEAQIAKFKEEQAILSEKNAKKLAKAKAALEEALRNIAAEANKLTDAEAAKVEAYATAYGEAMTAYETAYDNWTNAASGAATLYKQIYDKDKDYKAEYTEKLEEAQAKVDYWSAKLADFESTEPAQWSKKLEEYAEEIAALEYERIEIEGEAALDYVDFRAAVSELVEYAKQVVKSVDLPDDDVTVTAKAEIFENNEFLAHAIETLIAAAESETSFYLDFANGKMGFNNADKDYVEKVLFGVPEESADEVDVLGLKNIVEILTMKGLINNPNYKEFADYYENLYNEADSIYTRDYERLTKGVAADTAIINATEKWAEDTAAFNAAVKDSTTAKAKLPTDTTEILKAVREVIKGFDDAVEDVYAAYKDIVEGEFGSISSSDSAAFVAAVKTLGEAQVKFFGKQDSLLMYQGFNATSGQKVRKDVELSKLELSGFAQQVSGNCANSLYGGTGYGWYNSHSNIVTEAWYQVSGLPKKEKAVTPNQNPFFRVILSFLQVSDNAYPTSAPTTLDGFKGMLKQNLAISGNAKADTVTWAKNNNNLKNSEAVAALKTDYAAMQKGKHDADSVNLVVASGNAKIIEATEAYYDMYNRFWGLAENSVGYATVDASGEATFAQNDSLKINWTEETFKDILKVYPNVDGDEVNGDFAFILPASGNAADYYVWNDSKLAAVLDALRNENADDASSYNDFVDNPENSHIIWGNASGSATELTQRAYYASLKDYFGNYTDNVAAIEKFQAGVAVLEKAYNDALAEYAKALEAILPQLAEIVGEFDAEDEDEVENAYEVLLDAIYYVADIDEASADAVQELYAEVYEEITSLEDLAEVFGTGTFAAEATKLLGKFVAANKEDDARLADIGYTISVLEKAKSLLESANEKLIATYNNASGNAIETSGDAQKVIDYFKGQIDAAQIEANLAQFKLERLAAGYDPDVIDKEAAERKLAQLEKELADKKAALEKAKAEYDAVMAEYSGYYTVAQN